ncbi:hypothetical protein KCU92_g10182, partial [Aureobasidium melanogenum]|jgi:hypothetical protein
MAATADLPIEHAASAVPATRPAHCLTLPNEILSMIASECAPADLKNMRLASKLMHQVATKPFARKKFSRRRFIFTYQSMKALVDITAHPDFGPHITCLTFGTHRMENFNVNKVSLDPQASHNDQIVRFDIYGAMHRAFINNDHHTKMLTLALENLKKCHNTGAILGVHDDLHHGDTRRRGYAFEASYQGFSPEQIDMPETLTAVMEARRRSGYPLKTLKLCLSSNTGSLQDLEDYGTDTLNSLLAKMRVGSGTNLDLHLNIWQYESYPKLKILSKFTRVEFSRHSFCEWADSSPLLKFGEAAYGMIWHAINSSALRSLFIETSDVDLNVLVCFLQHHGKSLRKLELRQIHMYAFQSPKALALTFLRFLRSGLPLTHLSIEGFEVGETIVIPESGLMVYEGKDKVVEGLDKLIQEVDEDYKEEYEDE